MILIISSSQDGHAQTVLDRLHKRGCNAAMLDLALFPQELQLSIDFDSRAGRKLSVRGGSSDVFSTDGDTLNFAECDVVWWRRPQPFKLHDAVDNHTDNSFAYTECEAAFWGLWLTLDAFWINHPSLDADAARKVYQLKVAQELGLEIPTTRITNSPERAQEFSARFGPDATVYKAFSGTREAWRETRLLKPEEVGMLENVKYAPVIFQEYVPADVDLRISMVGDDVFAAAIHSQNTSYKVDFRMTMEEAPVEAFDLPETVVKQLQLYMKRLGLVYGAIDMRLTPDGRYVFLEINPSGQWLFIEHRTGQAITDTFVSLLQNKSKNGSSK